MNGTSTTTGNPCDCQATPGSAGLALNKRVDYSYGMVLGVDDFRQEQYYLRGQQMLGNLLLHGSGTVCGLKVSLGQATNSGTAQVQIDPGFAVSPKGEWIWVDKPQCARLDQWIAAQKALPDPKRLNVGGTNTAYVTLCYKECETDLVPIAGRACASDDQSRAFSRVTESFAAAFSWDPPAQPMEDDIILFGTVMRRIGLVDGAGDDPTAAGGLFDQVRGLPATATNATPISLGRSTAPQNLRQALTVWTTEVRPAVLQGSCFGGTNVQDCLLLGTVNFSTDAAGALSATNAVTLDELRRPVLAPTRVLQEMLLPDTGGGSGAGHTFATLFLQNAQTLDAWIHHPALLNFPSNSVTVLLDGATAQATVNPSGTPTNFLRLTLGTNAATNSFTNASLVTVLFNSTNITEAASGTNPGRLLSAALSNRADVDLDNPMLTAFLPIGIGAEGDLTGNYLTPTVVGLQGRTVSPALPSTGNVLTWDGGRWLPSAAASVVILPQTNFVQANHGTYAIVAAGSFAQSLNAQGTLATLMPGSISGAVPGVAPTYNNLTATPNTNTGDIFLNFKGYDTTLSALSQNKLVYIVKGTVLGLRDGQLFPVLASFCFLGAEKNGLRIRLVGANGNINAAFSAEISAFGEFSPGF